MGSATLRPTKWLNDSNPNGTARGSTFVWAATGGGGTASSDAALLADNSDATYFTNSISYPNGDNYGGFLHFDTTALPAVTSQPIWSTLQFRVRASQASGSETLSFQLYRRLASSPDAWSYTTYTITPTSTISTYTLPMDTALAGLQFDKSATVYGNMPMLGIGVSSGSTTTPGDIRMYEVYLDATWDENGQPASVSVTPATGTIPKVSWVYSDPEGGPQAAYIVSIYSSTVYGAAGFDPITSYLQAAYSTRRNWGGAEPEVAGTDTSHQISTQLAGGTTYRAYVSVRDANHPAGTYRTNFVQFTADSAEAAYVFNTQVPDIGAARVKIGTSLSWAQNLLSADQATTESAVSGWTATNCTLARDTAQFYEGVASMKMTGSAAGTMSATTPTGTNAFPLAANTVDTALNGTSKGAFIAMVRFKTLGTYRTRNVYLQWWQASGAASAVRAQDSGTVSGSTDWQQVLTNGSIPIAPPSDAAFVSMKIEVTGMAAAGEVFYADVMGLVISPGYASYWIRPNTGTPTVTLQRQVGDDSQPWVNVAGATEMPVVYNVGTSFYIQLNGGVQTYDYGATPNSRIRYRWVTKQYLSDGITPTYSYPSQGNMMRSNPDGTGLQYEGIPQDGWWLKDATDATDNCNRLKISVRGSLRTTKREAQGRFRPLGRTREVVLSDGVVGDEIHLPLNFYNQGDYDEFERMRATGRTLVLQSDMSQQWFVHLGDTREAELPSSIIRKLRPYRAVEVTCIEVDPP